jgi:hypothetical protein
MDFIKHMREETFNILEFEDRECAKVLAGQGLYSSYSCRLPRNNRPKGAQAGKFHAFATFKLAVRV